jgi:hypothetical protein
MKEYHIYKVSNLGFFKVPDLEKIKASDLGYKLSPEKGIRHENIVKYGIF